MPAFEFRRLRVIWADGAYAGALQMWVLRLPGWPDVGRYVGGMLGDLLRKAGTKARSIHLLAGRHLKPQLAIQTAGPDFLRPCLERKRTLLLDFRRCVRGPNDFHADFGRAFQHNGIASVLL